MTTETCGYQTGYSKREDEEGQLRPEGTESDTVSQGRGLRSQSLYKD